MEPTGQDEFFLGGKKFTSRLLVGTGKFGNNKEILSVCEASQCEIVTVALRRVDLQKSADPILKYIPPHVTLLPNTSGARNAIEAIRIAHIARAAGLGNFVKIEVIPDNEYLMPDNEETIEATKVLASEGYIVLPYMSPDPIAARKVAEAGAAAIMPLGSPIGSNRGIKTAELIKIIIKQATIPVIVDAGLGRPSHAAEAMEMGASAVLVNTAIATAADPVAMAQAFSLATHAGRLAYCSQLPPQIFAANASSPLTGFLRDSSL